MVFDVVLSQLLKSRELLPVGRVLRVVRGTHLHMQVQGSASHPETHGSASPLLASH